ncbi:MAG: hypothetical protein R2784_16065 [Saprospiraceae bacterium]
MSGTKFVPGQISVGAVISKKIFGQSIAVHVKVSEADPQLVFPNACTRTFTISFALNPFIR